MSLRTEKVASLLKEELGSMFQRMYSVQKHGLVTVTDVSVTPDLRVAKVFVSIFGDEEKKKSTMQLIESSKSSIRGTLGHAIHLRFTPDLLFELDDSLDRAFHMEKLFHEIHTHDVPPPTDEIPSAE